MFILARNSWQACGAERKIRKIVCDVDGGWDTYPDQNKQACQ